jgi:hypothetical protein
MVLIGMALRYGKRGRGITIDTGGTAERWRLKTHSGITCWERGRTFGRAGVAAAVGTSGRRNIWQDDARAGGRDGNAWGGILYFQWQ